MIWLPEIDKFISVIIFVVSWVPVTYTVGITALVPAVACDWLTQSHDSCLVHKSCLCYCVL